MLVKLTLRLTTKVATSPASSARRPSAAARIASITSGRDSANSAVSSAALELGSPSRPLAIASGASPGSMPLPSPPLAWALRPLEPRGMKLQYLSLIRSRTPCSIHSGFMYCG